MLKVVICASYVIKAMDPFNTTKCLQKHSLSKLLPMSAGMGVVQNTSLLKSNDTKNDPVSS
jgi:hypothetical protein